MDAAVDADPRLVCGPADRGAHGRRATHPRPHAADRVRGAGDGRRRSPDRTVLLYGHLDKQPEMSGWRADLGPWTPVVEGDRLYGRGGADDGYAAFASLLAIEAAQAAGLAHARCVVLIEASEESGSPDLPAHVELLADRLGSPELVICLDSGCLDTERLWVTTSLRGLADGQPHRRGPHRRAPTRVRPAASCRRASGCCASSWTDSRTARPDTCRCPSCTSSSRSTAWSRPAGPRRASRAPRRRRVPIRRDHPADGRSIQPSSSSPRAGARR